jgi:hypothetical protein
VARQPHAALGVPYLPYLAFVGCAALLAQRIARGTDGRTPTLLIALWGAAVVAVVVVTLLVSTGRGTPFGDFDKAYYTAGRLALSSPSELYDCTHRDGLCFVNLPIVALAFVPFSILWTTTAHVVIAALGIVSVALIVWLLGVLAGADSRTRLVICTLVLANGPLYYSLRLGNLTHVVLVLLALAMLALQRRRWAAVGALLAVCAVLKPPFLLWLPYFAILPRTRRAAVSFIATGAALLAISVVWFGVDLHREWLTTFVAGPSSRPVGAYNNQSITGLLIRATTSRYLVDWVGLTLTPSLQLARTIACTAVLGSSAAVIWRTRASDTWAVLFAHQSILLCTMVLISPISWTHYYCFLLLPMAAWLCRPGLVRTWRDTAFAVGALLVSLPVTLWIPSHPFYGPVVARGLLSHYVVGAALLLAAVAAQLEHDRRNEVYGVTPPVAKLRRLKELDYR